MQKVLREQEYFKEITYDQIDKKLKFLERAIGGEVVSETESPVRQSSQ